jgi:beta-lactamase superfamily II metal-dependent hydrolase
MRRAFLRLFPVVFVLALLLAPAGPAAELTIHCIDVDQGDATLLVGPDGTAMLIDAGKTGMGYSTVIPLLNSLGITHLDAMVASHYHEDHVGGLDEVANGGFFPDAAYDRGTYGGTPGTSAYSQYASAIASVRRTIAAGDVIDLGGGATATCVVVNGYLLGGGQVNISGSAQFENSASVGLLIEYGDFQYLTMGDLTGGGYSTTDVEGPVGNIVGDIEVLRVSHHGSSTSSDLSFIQSITPDVALISVGADNAYGHPTNTTLNNLNRSSSSIPVLQTTRGIGNLGGVNMDATFSIHTDGTACRVERSGLSMRFVTDEAAALQPGPGDLIVSEYMNNPSKVSDSYGEYVEIFNPTTEDYSLEGVEFRDTGGDSFVFGGSVLVAAGERFVYGACGHQDMNGGFDASAVWPYQEFFLGNASDEIILEHGSSVLDGVYYDDGATYPDPSGRSVERIDFLGSTQGSNFAEAQALFGDGDRGTPGAKNSVDATDFRPVLVERGNLVPGGELSFTFHAYSDELLTGFAGLSYKDSPGITQNGVYIPLRWDGLFQFSMKQGGLFADLDGFGKGSALLDIPNDPGLTGLSFFAALVVLVPPRDVRDAQDAAVPLHIN